MRKKIDICGLPFKVKYVDVIEEASEGVIQGEIHYSQAEILISKRLPKRVQKRVLYHEILHGMLVQLGYNDLSSDEVFVTSLANAMYQMFKLKGGE